MALNRLKTKMRVPPAQETHKMVSKQTQTIMLGNLHQNGNSRSSSITIPSVSEQLFHLLPSKELMEYYRKKIKQYDDEQEEMLRKLDEYMKLSDQQYDLEKEIHQRNEQIAALQKALSDLQNVLLQEREHVLRLYSENDRLKIQEVEDRKKIQRLLSMTGKGSLEDEVIYYMEEPRDKVIIPQKSGYVNNTWKQTEVKRLIDEKGKEKRHLPKSQQSVWKEGQDVSSLKLQVESLQAQLEEQARVSRDHAHALAEDNRVTRQEAETQHNRDAEKIKNLTNKLKRTEELLHLSTCECLEFRKTLRKKETDWMAQKDNFLQQLSTLKKGIKNGKEFQQIFLDSTLGTQIDSHQPLETHASAQPSLISQQEKQQLQSHLNSVRSDLEESKNLMHLYHDQCIKLEEEIAKEREQHEASEAIYKQRTERLSNQLQTANSRLKQLERYRRLELQGFKTDIKNLKAKIQDGEKQLLKVALQLERGERDMELLKAVHVTAKHSKHITDDLKALKLRLYQIEEDLRHL